MKIVASVISNIQTDQRVNKVCNSLVSNGFEVSLIGTDLGGKPKLNTKFSTAVIPMYFKRSSLMYAEFNIRLFFRLLFSSKKDTILLANDLDSLLPNYIISELFGLPLVFDSHEIYSELPTLHDRPKVKKVWKWLESNLVPRLTYFYTVSDGYAGWFEKEYGIRPQVIRNVPVLAASDISQNVTIKLPDISPNEKIILYQGAINFSRGIEQMMLAMQFIENVQLWIIGDGPKKREYEAFRENLAWKDRIYFLGSQLPETLRNITPKVNIGLSLEEDLGLSYRYALPNKLFDYIHAGIPVLGTYLPEIKRTIEHYGIGKTIENHRPEHIAEKIKELLLDGKENYRENLDIAKKEFNWKFEEIKLIELFRTIENE